MNPFIHRTMLLCIFQLNRLAKAQVCVWHLVDEGKQFSLLSSLLINVFGTTERINVWHALVFKNYCRQKGASLGSYFTRHHSIIKKHTRNWYNRLSWFEEGWEIKFGSRGLKLGRCWKLDRGGRTWYKLGGHWKFLTQEVTWKKYYRR